MVSVNKKGVNRKLFFHEERQISGHKPTKEILNHKLEEVNKVVYICRGRESKKT